MTVKIIKLFLDSYLFRFSRIAITLLIVNSREKAEQRRGNAARRYWEIFEFYLRSKAENSSEMLNDRCSIGTAARDGRCRERRRRENDRGAARSLMEL